MKKPIVHLNGSGIDNLERQWRAVHEATLKLLTALNESFPHGRDYYVDPDPDALKKAEREHQARREQAYATLADAESMLIHLSNARDERNRQRV